MPTVMAYNFDVPWEFSKCLHIVGGLRPFLGAGITYYLFDEQASVIIYLRDNLRNQSIKCTLIVLGMPIAFFLIATLIVSKLTGEVFVSSDLRLNSKRPITSQFLI